MPDTPKSAPFSTSRRTPSATLCGKRRKSATRPSSISCWKMEQQASGRISTGSADAILEAVALEGLAVRLDPGKRMRMQIICLPRAI